MSCAQSKDGVCLSLIQGYEHCTPEEEEVLCRARPHTCMTTCDPDCDTPCHEAHSVRWRRQHEPSPEEEPHGHTD